MKASSTLGSVVRLAVATTAKPIEGFDEVLWALPLATVDGRAFAMLAYDDWRRSEVYEISLDGIATHRFSTTGYIESWVRIR